jgi:hypothetical protein
MKYLKYIENYSAVYNVGDYIALWYEEKICEIVDIVGITDFKIIWHIQNREIETIINYVNIKRKATPEEIEKFKMEIETNKYNI